MKPALPGQELVEAGVAELAHGRKSAEALLVSLTAPRLAAVGVAVPDPLPSYQRAAACAR